MQYWHDGQNRYPSAARTSQEYIRIPAGRIKRYKCCGKEKDCSTENSFRKVTFLPVIIKTLKEYEPNQYIMM